MRTKTSTKTILALALPLVACTSRDPEPDAPATPELEEPTVAAPTETDHGPASLADAIDELELPDEVAAELMRIDDAQFEFENQMAGVREDPDDVGWVTARLANMVAVDQLLRNSMMLPAEKGWDAETSQAFMQVVGQRTMDIDSQNTHELRALVERHGWFNISTFGSQADRDAWLLVQHADRDPAFQKEILAVLEELLPLGETSPSNYAYLYDRVARAEGRPQRYGTQGGCVGDRWEPHTLEDPERVDELRTSVGLSSLEEYQEICSQFCR